MERCDEEAEELPSKRYTLRFRIVQRVILMTNKMKMMLLMMTESGDRRVPGDQPKQREANVESVDKDKHGE